MTAPQPGPAPGQLATAVEALTLQVDRDTVLQARAALSTELMRLQQEMQLASFDRGVGRCGGDPVSNDAAAAFNERIDHLFSICYAYTKTLEAATVTLAEVARQYGYTEDQITSSFIAQ